MDNELLKLQGLLERADVDIRKAKAGNRAAIVRVRKALQELKIKTQKLRVEMLEYRV